MIRTCAVRVCPEADVTHPAAPQDPVSLDALYLRYSRWLRNQAAQRFGADRAEDLVQDTWAKLAALESLSSIKHPRAFLMRVMANGAISGFRRTGGEHSGTFEPGKQSTAASQEQAFLLRQVILGLPQPLRDVFVMSRFGGLTNAQIAERLGISPKTVEWRMTKALAHCAAQLRA